MSSSPKTIKWPGGRPLLLAGFGSLLLLMLVAGGYALRTLEQVRTSDLEERDSYLRRDRALDEVRTGIYQSAIVMRDYLLARMKRVALRRSNGLTKPANKPTRPWPNAPP